MSEEKKKPKLPVALKVMEAYTRDVGRGVIRMDYASMDAINVNTSDIVKITGTKTTLAKALPIYPTDEGKGVARFDGLVRNNAGVAIGDVVSIEKVMTLPAESITVCWADKTERQTINERYLADALESVPVIIGDTVMTPYFGGRLTFKVLKMAPESFGVVRAKTVFKIVENASEVKPTITYMEYRYIVGDTNLNNFLHVEAVRSAGKNLTIYQRWRVEKWLPLFPDNNGPMDELKHSRVVAIVSRQVNEVVENEKTD